MSVTAISARWWSRPELARVALDSVAAAPGAVEQAVGSSLLGYHALAAEALAPLGRRTLVDVSWIEQALAEVDLEPVAKAFAAAQRDALGSEADWYGRDLAQEIHENATAASRRLALGWTSSGLPWPYAVERAAEVHGVPLPYLGGYAHQMRVPHVAEIVRADAADRVLMGYAAALGRREAGSYAVVKSLGLAPVVKELTGAAAAEFEREHPRGRGGRFAATSGDQADVERAARAARAERSGRAQRARIVRVERTTARQQATEQQRQEQESRSQAPAARLKQAQGAADAVQGLKALPRLAPAARARTAPSLKAVATGNRRAARSALPQAAPAAAPAAEQKQAAQVSMARETAYVPVRGDQIEELLKHGGRFHVGAMRKILGGQDMTAYSESQIQTLAGERGMVLLKIEGGAPLVDGGLDDAFGGALAHDARFEINPMMDYLDIGPAAGNPWDPPGMTGPPVPVYDISLQNGDWLLEHGDRRDDVGKAFDEREHPRAADGRFADKRDDGSAERAARAARSERAGRAGRARADRQRQIADYQAAVRRLQAQRQEQRAQAPADQVAALRALPRLTKAPAAARAANRQARPARAALAQVYARADVAASEQVDFAHEVAFVLTPQQFGHLTGHDPMDLEPLDAMGPGGAGEELQAATAAETHFATADAALDHLIRRASAERTAPTSRRVPGVRLETSEWRAIAAAEDELAALGRDDREWDWAPGAEPAAFGEDGAPTAFRPVLYGVRPSEPPIMLLGDRGAADALLGGGQVELEELDAADLSELLALRSDDDVLDGLAWGGARESAPLRVFRVRTSDDGTTS